MEKTKKLSILNVLKSGFSPGSSGREAAKVYKRNKAKKNSEIVFENIKNCLARGETVRVANFGTFGTRQRATRTARNPRTGEKISVQTMNTPFFRADKKLKEKVKS
ncbi:Integration host factor subunit beta [subsurface metagenome]